MWTGNPNLLPMWYGDGGEIDRSTERDPLPGVAQAYCPTCAPRPPSHCRAVNAL